MGKTVKDTYTIDKSENFMQKVLREEHLHVLEIYKIKRSLERDMLLIQLMWI